MSNTLTTENKQMNPVAQFSRFMDTFKPQMALALPKHLTPDRMARLALTAFSTTPKLQQCDPRSIAASVMTASTLGLEPGVNGQGFLVPYGTTCTFVPGWKGLVDIVNRSGRATVWTGAVFDGDHFDYALGDRPFVQHRPGDEDDPGRLTHVYAIGRVNGSDWPVIEVWTMRKVWRHRDQYNKVGKSHYSFRDPEMYARKVALLQVLKYMPSSIEVSNAIAAVNAAENGRNATIDGNFVSFPDRPDDGDSDSGPSQGGGGRATDKPELTTEEFQKKSEGWKKAIAGGKAVNDLIATAETKNTLTLAQKTEIASWAQKPATEGAAT